LTGVVASPTYVLIAAEFKRSWVEVQVLFYT
jgi:hypothetical protein